MQLRNWCDYVSRHWLWTGPHALIVRLGVAEHREAAAGPRDEHRDDVLPS